MFFWVGYQAQMTLHPALSVGYGYYQKSYAMVGMKVIGLEKDENLYRLGAQAMLSMENKKVKILPKIEAEWLFNFSKNRDVSYGYYYLAGVEASSVFISPKIGISILSLIDVTAGYAFGFKNDDLHKGFNANVSVNIPLSVFNL